MSEREDIDKVRDTGTWMRERKTSTKIERQSEREKKVILGFEKTKGDRLKTNTSIRWRQTNVVVRRRSERDGIVA